MSERETTYTYAQVVTALNDAESYVMNVSGSEDADAAMSEVLARTLAALPELAAPFTRGQLSAAMNTAADDVAEESHHNLETSDTIRQDDTVNLAVNAAGHLLEHPGASLEDAIEASYDAMDGECESCGADVMAWPEGASGNPAGWVTYMTPDDATPGRPSKARYCPLSPDHLHHSDGIVSKVLGWVE
jgi:hypothetical protein